MTAPIIAFIRLDVAPATPHLCSFAPGSAFLTDRLVPPGVETWTTFRGVDGAKNGESGTAFGAIVRKLSAQPVGMASVKRRLLKSRPILYRSAGWGRSTCCVVRRRLWKSRPTDRVAGLGDQEIANGGRQAPRFTPVRLRQVVLMLTGKIRVVLSTELV